MTKDSENLGGISAKKPVIARPYAVGIFDVLGFKSKFAQLGLREVTARYAALIDIVVKRDEHLEEMRTFFPDFKEAPYWYAGGEIGIMTNVYMAYASDTFLVWTNYTWTELHQENDEELERLSKDPTHDWLFLPVPCDPFLDICNELICRSLQVGLPLRGALAVGDAILDKERRIFLGGPIIEANLLEHEQKFIGAGICNSFVDQTIPRRFTLSFNKQLKESAEIDASGLILDWPRHWRNTRSVDIKEVIGSMDTDDRFSDYYQNTLVSIDESEAFAKDFDPGQSCPIRSNYEQFSYSRQGNIAARVRAVRSATPDEVAKILKKANKSNRRGKRQTLRG